MNQIDVKSQLHVEKQAKLQLGLVDEYRSSINAMLRNGELCFKHDIVKSLHNLPRKIA